MDEELRRRIRELDRDLAIFAYRVGNRSEENRRIRERFVPNEGNMRAARETWSLLKKRVEALEEPDAVISLLKHHFRDFIDSLEYTMDGAERHPESACLNLDSILQGVSRCSRQPDEDRLEQLLQTRYTDELNHAQLMISRQANESGEARISTLKEIQSHIYAADALSMYKVSAFGGAEYMATDTFAQLNSLIEQSINHIRGGSDTSAVLSELSEIINTLQHAFD